MRIKGRNLGCCPYTTITHQVKNYWEIQFANLQHIKELQQSQHEDLPETQSYKPVCPSSQWFLSFFKCCNESLGAWTIRVQGRLIMLFAGSQLYIREGLRPWEVIVHDLEAYELIAQAIKQICVTPGLKKNLNRSSVLRRKINLQVVLQGTIQWQLELSCYPANMNPLSSQ